MLPIGDRNEPGAPALLNLGIIAANVLVFVLLQLPSDEFTMAYSAIPAEITTGRDLVGPVDIVLPDGSREQIPHADGPEPIWLTLLSSMFMHGGWAHLLGNMLFLYVFGDNVERALGAVRYAGFYVVCGVLGSIAHVLSGPDSPIPSLGASGAISGVLAAYLVMFPRNPVRVLVFFRFVSEVPALVMIGLWAALQFLNGFIALSEETAVSGVAYMAHIGGFVAGLLLALVLRPGQRPTAFAR